MRVLLHTSFYLPRANEMLRHATPHPKLSGLNEQNDYTELFQTCVDNCMKKISAVIFVLKVCWYLAVGEHGWG